MHDTPHAQLPSPWLAGVSLRNLVDRPGSDGLETLGMTLREFAAIPPCCSGLLAGLPDCEVQPIDGGNTEKDVSVYAVAGRARVTPARFVALDKAMATAWTVAPADVQTAHAGPKRQRKAVDRTLVFLDQVREGITHPELRLFGAIVGGGDEASRARSTDETARRPLAGFAIEGLAHGLGPKARDRMVEAVVSRLPDDKPRLARCRGHPLEVLDLIASGIDLFDAAYPVIMAEQGHVLTFSFDDAGSEMAEMKDGVDTSASTLSHATVGLSLCLWDTMFAADMTPLSGAASYTRAYIHHLLVTHEMLATVALTAHNVAHYLQFFHHVRTSIVEGDFSDKRDKFIACYTRLPTAPNVGESQ